MLCLKILARREGGIMRRAKASGVKLDAAAAATVKGMVARGDRQHDIASWFGVNGGRIGEIATGKAFSTVSAAHMDKLPPPGPYLSGRASMVVLGALKKAQEALTDAESLITGK